MSTIQFLGSKYKSLKADGSVNASGTVEFFAVGGTFSTYVTSYSDSGLTVPNQNIVTLDAAGEADIWLNSSADVRIKDSSGAILDTFLNWNPTSTSALTSNTAYNSVLNGSFEDGVGADGQPSNWTISLYTGGAQSLDTTSQGHGQTSLKFTTVGTGGGYATTTTSFAIAPSELYELSWRMNSSVANIRNLVQIFWYKADGSASATPSVNAFDDSATNPTSWTVKTYNATAPSDAYFAKVRFTGGHSSNANSGNVGYDDIQFLQAHVYGTRTFAGANTHSGANTFSGINTFSAAQLFTATPTGKFDGYVSNYSLTATVAANALTIALKDAAGNDPSATSPVYVPFRNVTSATGTHTWLSVTAATSVVVSSGSTLGTVSAVLNQLAIVAFNDASTFRLGVANIVGLSVQDDVIASSTAEGGAGAADSAATYYTGTAVTSKALKILGLVESTQATAGTWATSPSNIQLGNEWLVNKKDQQGVAHLAIKTASSSATLVFAPTDFDWTIYDRYEFELINLLPATDTATLRVTISPDGGSTYADGAYKWVNVGADAAGTSIAANSTGDSAITVGTNVSSLAADSGLSGTLVLVKPSNASTSKHIFWTGICSFSTSDHPCVFTGSAWSQDNSPQVLTAAVNAIKFAFSAGNITSGSIRARGYKNS